MRTEDDDDRDLPLESDTDPDPDGPALDECPHCRKMVLEDTEWCHHCGQYLSTEDAPKHMSGWLIAGLIASALAVATFILFGH